VEPTLSRMLFKVGGDVAGRRREREQQRTEKERQGISFYEFSVLVPLAIDALQGDKHRLLAEEDSEDSL
jgi:hypothetical protein